MAEQKRLEAGLAAAQARNAEVLKLYERIYEDNVNGKVSDEWFMLLSKKYEEEKAELKAISHKDVRKHPMKKAD